MVVWYLNHYATPPLYGSPGRPFHLAHYFLEKGHNFINFCASSHHLRKKPAKPEDIDQIKIFSDVPYYHLKTIKYRGNGIFRIINMIDYTFGIKRLAKKIVAGELSKPDIVIPSCVHIFSYPGASYLKRKFDVKLIYEVRDIWPLSLIELADVSPMNPIIIWMKRIERNAYNEADAVVSLLRDALEHMQPLGLNLERFHYIPNGVNEEEWRIRSVSIPETHNKVFDWCRKKNKMIVIYTGAHGPPNALDQVFPLKNLVENGDLPYHFVVIGEGVIKDQLMKQAEREKINFVSFLPGVSKDVARACIEKADICFMPLRDSSIFRFGVSPNKLGDYLMSGKPVLYAVKAGNNPVKESGAGISVQPYHTRQLDEALRKFSKMSIKERYKMGQNGKQYALRNLEWTVLSKRYLDICENLIIT
jgi:glycosyltransferase involved in cell wall biosynthesis